MINADAISLMKKGVVVLNFARDLLVDEEAMVDALVAGQVKFRPATVLYSGKDYVILAYDAQNKDGIRLYDEIITEGKDLYNGKVYT